MRFDDRVPLPRHAEDDIGGAIVRRSFQFAERSLTYGDRLSEKEVRSIPQANRNALRDGGFLQVYPKQSSVDRHVVHRGSGKYDVIEGVKVNAEPLSKEDAEALASTPLARAAA